LFKQRSVYISTVFEQNKRSKLQKDYKSAFDQITKKLQKKGIILTL
jgi:hypothetical protein